MSKYNGRNGNGYQPLPAPPPMRKPAKEPFASSTVLVIVLALAVGVMAGWQMHGGVCS